MATEISDLQALDIWRRTVVASVRRDAPDLSARQMSLLLTVYLTPAPHTVRCLAELLKVTKPAITRAVDRLTEHGMIRRKVDENDDIDYQTVFACSEGSVAAPTASLHFDNSLISKLETMGVKLSYVTLHVGGGTFCQLKLKIFQNIKCTVSTVSCHLKLRKR